MVGFGEFHPALPRASQPLDGLAARIPWDPEPGFAQKLAIPRMSLPGSAEVA